MSAVRFAVIGWMVGEALRAQTSAPVSDPAPLPYPPVRVEFGGYGEGFTNGGGWWRGADAAIWLRKSRRFVPGFTFDNRTSEAGSQQYFSLFSYANWSSSFYTTQGISGSTHSANGVTLFPRFRYDLKAWWKIPPRRGVIPGLGFTRFTFGGRNQGDIINPGVLYYRGSFVVDTEGFLNRSQPAALWSGSGLFAIQQGQEGKHWIAITFGGGRQVYRALSTVPLEARLTSLSVDASYRHWVSRNFGFVFAAGYQNSVHNYERISISGHLFFEF